MLLLIANVRIYANLFLHNLKVLIHKVLHFSGGIALLTKHLLLSICVSLQLSQHHVGLCLLDLLQLLIPLLQVEHLCQTLLLSALPKLNLASIGKPHIVLFIVQKLALHM